MRIGELLIMNGFLTEEQLDEALKEQTLRPVKLGEILTTKGFITERQLVEALEFQLGVPVANLDETVSDVSAVTLVHDSIARRYRLVPLQCSGGHIKVAMEDPNNQEAIRKVQMSTGLHVKPLIATRTQVEQAILRYYGADESAVAWTEIIETAAKRKAAYIHLEPRENGLMVKLRAEQQLLALKTLPPALQKALTDRLLSLSGLDTVGQALPQYGRFLQQAGGVPLEIQVSVLPTVHGSSMVLRLTDESESAPQLSGLSFGEANLQKVEKALEQHSGLVLIAGPAGSGITTALYSCLQHLDHNRLRILSLEDPIERRMNGVSQVEVNEQTGFTFAQALRSSLRQDPNVILVGDIRDRETAELASRAALSHKLVLGGIHADHAVHAITRLSDLGLDAYRISSSLSCIVAQRLVRGICRQCAQSVPVTDEEMGRFESAGLLPAEEQKNGGKGLFGNFRSIVSAQMSGKMTLLRGTGCRLCHETGYRGLIAIQEVLPVDDTVRRWILEKRPVSELEPSLAQNGYRSMLYDGLRKARDGLTTVEEVMAALPAY